MPDAEPQDRPPPPEDQPNPSSGTLDSTRSRLKEQRHQYERRSEVLDALRQRLSKHIDKQNRVLLDRQRALDIRRMQSDRERAYLNDARLYLRRCRQEEDEEIRRLQLKARHIETQAQQLQRERSELGEELERTHEDYQARIDGLLTDKQAVEQRLQVLQSELTEARDRPPPVAARGRALSDWRLGLAVLAGFVCIGVLFLAGRFEYRVHLTLAGDPALVSPDQLEYHRSELARSLSVLDAGERPLFTLDPDHASIDVCLLSPQAAEARDELRRQVELHLTDLQQQRQRRAVDLQDGLADVGGRLSDARQEFERLVTTLADQRLSAQVENPRAELQQLRTSLAAARGRFEDVRTAFEASDQHLEELRTASLPAEPQLDPAVLRAEEAEDTQLHLDTEQLRFQLNSLRRHLLGAFVEFPERVESFSTAAQQLGTYLETARLDLRDGPTLEILDAMRQHSERLEGLIIAFDRDWTQLADRLQRLAVDPRDPATPQIQRSAETLVEDLNGDTNGILKALQQEQQKYIRGLDNQAEHFQLTSNLKDRLQRIHEAQYAFMTLAGRVRAASDIQLETILHRVLGLARRTRQRREEIARDITARRREELRQELEEAVEGELARRDELAASRQEVLDGMLALQDRLNGLIPYIEEHGITSTVVRYTKVEADALSARIAQLEEQERAARSELAGLQSSEHSLEILSTAVDPWPANAARRLANIFSGGIAVAVVSFLLLMMMVPARRETAS